MSRFAAIFGRLLLVRACEMAWASDRQKKAFDRLIISICSGMIAVALGLLFPITRPVDVFVFWGAWVVAAVNTAIYMVESHRAKRRE